MTDRLTDADLDAIGQRLTEGRIVNVVAQRALLAEVRRLRAIEQRVRALHCSVGIYDECDCPDDAKAEGHLDIYEIGMTCNKVYDICGECCRNDEYQTEDCAACHEHQLGETYRCPTIDALDGGER